MGRGLNDVNSDVRDDSWWSERYELAEKTKSDFRGIKVREELAEALYDEGMLEEASKMWKEVGIIAEKFPEIKKNAVKYFDNSNAIKKELNKINNSKGFKSSHTNTFLIVIALLGIIIGILMLSPNFTGNVIVTQETDVTNWVGVILIIIGCIFALWYMIENEIRD